MIRRIRDALTNQVRRPIRIKQSTKFRIFYFFGSTCCRLISIEHKVLPAQGLSKQRDMEPVSVGGGTFKGSLAIISHYLDLYEGCLNAFIRIFRSVSDCDLRAVLRIWTQNLCLWEWLRVCGRHVGQKFNVDAKIRPFD